MTAKKKAPAKRGRKPKPPGDKVEQLTVRLPPKLKFGLELLSNAQKRSLSQVIEWALQVGLNSYRVGAKGRTVGEALDIAWQHDDDPTRFLTLYGVAPELLSFEQSASCELVLYSVENERADEAFKESAEIWSYNEKNGPVDDFWVISSNLRAAGLWRQTIVHRFAQREWAKITEAAIRMLHEGKDLRARELLRVVGLERPDGKPVEFNFVVMSEHLGLPVPEWARKDAEPT